MKTTLKRRELIRLAAGAAVIAGGASALARESSTAAADSTLNVFLAEYFGGRARSSVDGDVSRLDPLLDPANPSLRAFERDRASFIAKGLPQVWDGRILGHDSTIAVSSLEVDGARARVRLSETIRTVWIQNVHPISQAAAEIYRKYPKKFLPPANRGPNGEVTSYGTLPHEVELIRHSSGWRVVRDEYEQDMNFGRSPDLTRGGWAAIWYGKSAGGPTAASPKGPGNAALIIDSQEVTVAGEYSGAGAAWYAHTYWGGGAGNDTGYNCPPYVNYNSCGGDCANFVSQCFRAGGDASTSSWKTTTGTACGQSNRLVGTLEWVNNQSLRTFLINSGRGYAWYDIATMGIGDMINYDIYGDWYMRHVVLVSANAPGSNPLITGHNQNVYDRPYNIFSGNRQLTWHWADY